MRHTLHALRIEVDRVEGARQKAISEVVGKGKKVRKTVSLNPATHYALAFQDAMDAVRTGRKKLVVPGAEFLREFIANVVRAQPRIG